MTGIRKELDDLGRLVREEATRAFFMEQDYKIARRDSSLSEGDHTMGGDYSPTLDQYKNAGGDMDGWNDQNVFREGGDVWNYEYAKFAWVEQLFARFGCADEQAIYDLRQHMLDVAAKLRADSSWTPAFRVGTETTSKKDDAASDLERTLNLEAADQKDQERMLLVNGMDQLSDWTGAAADAFYSVFGADGTYWAQRLFADYCLIEALVGALEAKFQLVCTTRHGVMQLGEATVDALKAVAVGDGGSDPSLGLAIAGGLVAVVFAAAFPLATPVTAALVGAAISITSETIKIAAAGSNPGVQADKEVAIEGDTVEAVMSSFSDKMDTIIGDYYDREQAIRSGLAGFYEAILSPTGEGTTYRQHEFEVTFADGAPFAGTTQDNLYDDSRLGTCLQVDPEKLLSGASDFVTAAAWILDTNQLLKETSTMDQGSTAFHREITISGVPYTDGIAADWKDLRDLAQDILATNGAVLKQTAQVLVWAAEDYEATDDGNGRSLDDVQSQLDGVGAPSESGNDHDPSAPPPSMDEPI